MHGSSICSSPLFGRYKRTLNVVWNNFHRRFHYRNTHFVIFSLPADEHILAGSTKISIPLFISLFAGTIIGEYFYLTTHEFSALLLSLICGTTLFYQVLCLLKKSTASAIPPISNPIPNKNRTQSKGLLKLLNAKKKAIIEPKIAPIHSKPIEITFLFSQGVLNTPLPSPQELSTLPLSLFGIQNPLYASLLNSQPEISPSMQGSTARAQPPTTIGSALNSLGTLTSSFINLFERLTYKLFALLCKPYFLSNYEVVSYE